MNLRSKKMGEIEQMIDRANEVLEATRAKVILCHIVLPLFLCAGIVAGGLLLRSPPRFVLAGWEALYICKWYKPALITCMVSGPVMSILLATKGFLRLKAQADVFYTVKVLQAKKDELKRKPVVEPGKISRPPKSLDDILRKSDELLTCAETAGVKRNSCTEIILYVAALCFSISAGLILATLFDSYIYYRIDLLHNYPIITLIVGAISLSGVLVCIPMVPYFLEKQSGLDSMVYLWGLAAIVAPIIIFTVLMVAVGVCAGICYLIWMLIQCVISFVAALIEIGKELLIGLIVVAVLISFFGNL